MSQVDRSEMIEIIHAMKGCTILMKRFLNDLYHEIMKYPINNTPETIVEDYDSIQSFVGYIEEDLKEMEGEVKKNV